jgi:hypothetical protein
MVPAVKADFKSPQRDSGIILYPGEFYFPILREKLNDGLQRITAKDCAIGFPGDGRDIDCVIKMSVTGKQPIYL